MNLLLERRAVGLVRRRAGADPRACARRGQLEGPPASAFAGGLAPSA